MLQYLFQKKARDKASTLNVVEQVEPGEPTVFLHGLGGTSRYWTCKLKRRPLAGRVLFVDLLGFGDSPQPWCRYTVERHVEALHATLNRLGPVTLVGHSLGAALALLFAARYPDKVKALVLISLPCFGSQKHAFDWLRRAPSGWIYTNMLIAGFACIITRRIAGKILPLFLTDYPREVAEDVVKHNVMSSITSLWNILYRHDLGQEAAAVAADVPVLCIHAKDDDTAPFAAIEALSKALPNWQLLSLEGPRHHPWLWDTVACRIAIEEFLQTQGGRPFNR